MTTQRKPDTSLSRALTTSASRKDFETETFVVGGGVSKAVAENQRGELRLTETSSALSLGGGKPGQGYAAALVSEGVRRLTPRERERLQGFPDDWTEGESDSARDRMTGNAVCVPVAEWIGRRLVATHERFFGEEDTA